MSRTCALLTTIVLLSVSVGAQKTTLAEAAAAAAKITHEWPASANAVPIARVAPAADGVDPVSVLVSTAPATAAPVSATSGEAYWKGRKRDLQMTRDNNQSFLTAAVLTERTLDRQLHKNADDSDYIRDRLRLATVENQWQDAVKDVNRLRALTQNDTRMMAAFELEAHRAGALPGWLVLE